MTEPFFAPRPQLWSTVPVPGYSYFQTIPATHPMGPAASSPLGVSQTPFAAVLPSAPIAGNASSADPTQSLSGSWAVAAPPIGIGMPVLTAPDFATGVTAPALLATVAVRRGQPMGPTNDHETEDFISDALDLLAGANDVEVRCEGGRATLTGSVPHKRLKRDAGEIVWAIPSINDVQNNITIAARRRSRPSTREAETAIVAATGRK